MIPQEIFYAGVLWILGMIFILTVLEPEGDTPPRNIVLLALFWPFYTVFLVAYEIFNYFDK